MRKVQLVLRPWERAAHADFARRVADEIVPALSPAAEALKVVVTERPPPRLAALPFSRAPIAVASLWSPREPLPELRGVRAAAYEVDEALPVAYDKTWADGEPTPGVCLLTLFSRKRGLDDATFFSRWHDGHTPLSLEVHPLFGYVRNVVRRTMEGPPLDGIVEEQFREAEDLLDVRRMYGQGRLFSALPNMVRVGIDIAGFIDLCAMEVFLATERWVRSPTRSRRAVGT